MNNEEKILTMLEKLNGTVEKQGEMLECINQRMDQMDSRMDQLGSRMDQLDERSQRTAVLLETEITRKLDLLYEGHDAIMESLDRLASKSRVEELEDDVALLKDAVKLMRQEIAELKKAQ